MAIKVTIETQRFTTKTQATEHFTKMLARYANRQDVTGADFDDLYSLLEKHPRAGEKIGAGVKRIFADWIRDGARCFWVERIDGTKEDFSIRKCIDTASVDF